MKDGFLESKCLSESNGSSAFSYYPPPFPHQTFVFEFAKDFQWQIYCRPQWNLIYFDIISTKRSAIAQTARSTALAIARAMCDKKATEPLILQVAPLTTVADYLVIGSADSDRQAGAIADHVTSSLARSGSKPLSVEGARSAQWVLIDFGDVIAHIFRQDAREHYALERLWADAKRVPIPYEPPVTNPAVTTRFMKRKKVSVKKKA